MFGRYKLDDGGELFVHKEAISVVFANVNGQGETVWQKRMSLKEAEDLKRFLTSQL